MHGPENQEVQVMVFTCFYKTTKSYTQCSFYSLLFESYGPHHHTLLLKCLSPHTLCKGTVLHSHRCLKYDQIPHYIR